MAPPLSLSLSIPIPFGIALPTHARIECGSENNKSRFCTAPIAVSLLQKTNGGRKVNQVEKGLVCQRAVYEAQLTP